MVCVVRLLLVMLHSCKHCVVSHQALEDAFLAIDSRITTEEVIKELVQIAGRPTEEPPIEKVADEDDCEYTPSNNSLHYTLFDCKET